MYKYFTRSFNTRFIERIYKQLDFNADDFYSVQVRAIVVQFNIAIRLYLIEPYPP